MGPTGFVFPASRFWSLVPASYPGSPWGVTPASRLWGLISASDPFGPLGVVGSLVRVVLKGFVGPVGLCAAVQVAKDVASRPPTAQLRRLASASDPGSPRGVVLGRFTAWILPTTVLRRFAAAADSLGRLPAMVVPADEALHCGEAGSPVVCGRDRGQCLGPPIGGA